MVDHGSAGRATVRDRTPASSLVAELWAEREQQGRPSPDRPAPERPPAAHRGPKKARARPGPSVALIAVAAVVVAAAGGVVVAQDNPRPSKAQFVAKADAVCGSTNPAVNSLPRAISYPGLAAAAATFVSATAAQLGQVQDVGLPGVLDRGKAAGVVNAMTATHDAGRSLQGAAAAADDARTAAAANVLLATTQEAEAKAADYGLSACATGMRPGVDVLFAGSNAVVKSGFVTKAGGICVAAVQRLDAVPKFKNTASDLRRFTEETLAVVEKLNADLRALPVPPGDAKVLSELFLAIDEGNAKSRDYMEMALAGVDKQRFAAGEKALDDASDAVDAKFAAYGLTTCAED